MTGFDDKLRYKLSTEWLARAKRVTPTASQTYSKSYRYYCEGAAPAFMAHGRGSHVWDVDGNEYVDLVLALGPITLGYNDEAVNRAIREQLERGIVFSQPVTLEVELAERICGIIPSAEMVRFVKNGSDATSAAIRLARAYTGKDIVLSCGYHGMQDWYIGSSENDLGVPAAVRDLIRTFPFNDAEALARSLNQHAGRVAAIILEPARVDAPAPGFLQQVRDLATRHGAILIFDEVVTGFRLALGGAQAYYNVTPDLTALGKGIANGMPLSAVVGRADIMELIDEGAFVSLTFGGEALSLAAGLATINELERRRSIEHMWRLGKMLADGTRTLIKEHGVEDMAYVTGLEVMPAVFFHAYRDVAANDVLSLFQQEVIARGVLFLGVSFLCGSHSQDDIASTLRAFAHGFETLSQLKRGTPVRELLHGETYRPVFKRNKH